MRIGKLSDQRRARKERKRHFNPLFKTTLVSSMEIEICAYVLNEFLIYWTNEQIEQKNY